MKEAISAHDGAIQSRAVGQQVAVAEAHTFSPVSRDSRAAWSAARQVLGLLLSPTQLLLM